MNRSFIVALVLSASAFSFSSCKRGDPVIARAGSIRITQSDLAKELANSPPAYQTYLSTLEGKRQFVDIILKEKLLLSAAEKSGIAGRKDFKRSIQDYEQRMKEQFTEYRKGLILREYLRELKDGDLKVSESDVRSYFDGHKDDFRNPKRISASHILCLTQDEAEAALGRLKRGENFGKVAQEVSKDPTAARGGLIGEVMRGDLSDLPEFEKALFELKPGQVSGVVRTKIGFHLIKKNGEVRMAGQDLEEATPYIRRILEKQKFDQWIEKTKKDQKVSVDEQALAAVPVAPASQENGIPEVPAASADER